MEAFCEVCGRSWAEDDPGVTYDRLTDTWQCFDEAACLGRRAALAPECRMVNPETGRNCQRMPHGDGRHAAAIIEEWE